MLHRRSAVLFPMAAVLLTAACGGGDTEETAAVATDTMMATTTMPPADSGMMAPPTTGATVDSAAQDPTALLETTITAAEGGLTNVPAATALGVIRQWQTTLRGQNNPALTQIADDLGTLEQQLQANPINAKDVGGTLTKLGEQTTTAAASAQGAAGERVRRLGTLLSQAGSQLSGS